MAPLVLSSVAAVVTSACNFSDFTKTTPPAAEPACSNSTVNTAAETSIVAYWSFNNAPDASAIGVWSDSVHQLALVPKHDSTTGATDPGYADTRLNGEGRAISFNGHQYAEFAGNAQDVISKGDFTLSAWLTLPSGGITASASIYPVVWPIVSSLGDAAHCGGYQLDLRVEDPATGPELVFLYQYVNTTDAGISCSEHRIVYPIDNSLWAWGTGRWHHVAASYREVGTEQASLAAYWDGVRATAGLDAVVTGRIADSNSSLYLGTNRENAEVGAPKLIGTLDDIAIFSSVLDENVLNDFVTASSTRPGPSYCRWNTYEQYDQVAQTPSLSTWAPESNPDELRVIILDNDWGAGFISARLAPAKDLTHLGTVHLEATIQNDRTDSNFQFSLARGNDFCTWLLPAGGAGSYDIDLSRPSSCSASTCQFSLTSVEWARIASDWRDAATQSQLQFAVRKLDFRAEGNPINPATYGGANGPKNWCWRPAAYELGALAWLVGDPSSASVSAILQGPSNSSSRLTADFGARVLDLTKCARIEMSGQFPQLEDIYKFSLALQDIHGSWKNWDIINGEVILGNPPQAASDTSGSAYAKFDRFLISKVNQISVQKPWLYPGTVNIEISDVRFYDINHNLDCEVWSIP